MCSRHVVFWALWIVIPASSLGCTQLRQDASDASTTVEDARVEDARVEDAGYDAQHDAADGASTSDAELTADAGPSEGGPVVDDGYTPEELCADLRAALCAVEHAPMTDPALTCEYLDETCRSLPLLVASGKVDYDEVAAKACAEKHPPAAEGMDLPWPPPLIELACQNVATGNIALGGGCYAEAIMLFGSECEEGYCKRDADQCPGTCSSYIRVGDDCDAYSLRCDPKDYCTYDTRVCAHYGAVGDECGDSLVCGEGLYCNSENQCVAKLPDGSPCSESDSACQSNECAWLGGDKGVCSTPGGLGQSCQVHEQCEFPLVCNVSVCAQSSSDGACRQDDNCGVGQGCEWTPTGYFCTALLVENASCDFTTPCQRDLQCAALDTDPRTCMPFGAVDDPCGDWRSCQPGLYCRTGADRRCVQIGELDDACDPLLSNACAQGFSCVWGDSTCQALGRTQGQSCSPLTNDSCAKDLFCSRATHTCVPAAQNGEVCNYMAQGSCIETHLCTCPEAEGCSSDPGQADPNEVCKPKLALNVTCNYDDECLSTRCEGTCQMRPPELELCLPP